MGERGSSSGWPTGALVGAILTAPLVAVLYLGRQLAGLPFAPFDVFDWMARVLPGRLVTFGIDSIVGVIRALGTGDISGQAKTAEQVLAVAGIFVAGVLSGAVLFLALRRWRRSGRSGLLAGLTLGAVLGGLVLLVTLSVNRAAATDPVTSAIWILLVFPAWGAVLGRVCDRLQGDAREGRVAVGAPAASVEPIDRRRFIVRLGGSAAVITVLGAGVGAWIGSGRERRGARSQRVPWSAEHQLPNADAAVEPVRGTRPEFTAVRDHYRIDINTTSPVVREERWRLRVFGQVEEPGEWTLTDLRTGYDPLHQFITLSCISNPIAGSLIGTQRWTGVPLRRLLQEVRPRPGATHLWVRSVDDFHEIVPIEHVVADERIMLTYAWDGLPLPTEHGFPLRIYIPDRYGMKQPKWIKEIEAIDHDEEGYWVRRGWDELARMKATSVIDTVGVDMMVVGADRTSVIPIGGIAHAGARGISRVEVRVDDGDWQEAGLREPLSDKTWVLWRFEWPFREGDHTFTVRCFDGDGRPQIAERTPVRPDGATGLHSEDVML